MMTLRYSLTSKEVSKSFHQQLRHSASFRNRIFMYAVFMAFIFSFPAILRQHIRPIDVILTVVAPVAFVFTMPILLGLLAKPQERILTINDYGIETSIGQKSGAVPWSAISDVTQDANYVYVIGKTGNSFIIPSRAFTSMEQRAIFTKLTTQYLFRQGT